MCIYWWSQSGDLHIPGSKTPLTLLCPQFEGAPGHFQSLYFFTTILIMWDKKKNRDTPQNKSFTSWYSFKLKATNQTFHCPSAKLWAETLINPILSPKRFTTYTDCLTRVCLHFVLCPQCWTHTKYHVTAAHRLLSFSLSTVLMHQCTYMMTT